MENPTGRLSLVFRKRADGRTAIAQQYFRLPLQIMNPYYQDDDGTAFVYLLNPSGGILQNDRLLTELTLEENSRALITTPGNTKFYKMDDGHAEVRNVVRLEKGAVLEYLPEHNVPFAGSEAYQENDFYLHKDSVLIATDMASAGRTSRGEHFDYDVFSSRTRIFVDGRLRVYDRFCIEPERMKVRNLGYMEGYLANGTIYVYAGNISDSFVRDLNNAGISSKVRFAAGRLDEEIMIVRFLGDDIIELQNTILTAWDHIRREVLGKAAVRIRKY